MLANEAVKTESPRVQELALPQLMLLFGLCCHVLAGSEDEWHVNSSRIIWRTINEFLLGAGCLHSVLQYSGLCCHASSQHLLWRQSRVFTLCKQHCEVRFPGILRCYCFKVTSVLIASVPIRGFPKRLVCLLPCCTVLYVHLQRPLIQQLCITCRRTLSLRKGELLCHLCFS